jgi:transposase
MAYREPGAGWLYQQLDVLQSLRREARRDLLAESQKPAQLDCHDGSPIGPIRAALLIAFIQTPHRFRTKRRGEYRYGKGQLQRAKKHSNVRGLNKNHNHDLKYLFKSTAMRVSCCAGPLQDFYAARGIKPDMARLTLARKIAEITLTVWKKRERSDAECLKQQAV